MVFKINLSTKDGKTYKLEAEAPELIGKSLKDTIKGENINADLHGYEMQIMGTSDSSGFTSMEKVEGFMLKRILLTYGKGMHKRPKREGKKKVSNFTPDGLRLRKLVRGKIISENITQINIKVLKLQKRKLKWQRKNS